MNLLENDELVFVICHELGHLLGHVPRGPEFRRIHVEGEADYFGGKCAADFFGENAEMAIDSARHTLAKLNKERTIAETALCQNYDGVNMGSLKHDCRLLSAMHGARGLRRPSCWYNP